MPEIGLLYASSTGNTERGATVIGAWPTDTHAFDASSAVVDGEFVGLAIDEDNQSDLSGARIEARVEQITPYAKGAA